MAVYGEMPNGWRLHNVSMGGEPAWIKTFEVERDPKQYARAVQVASKFGSAGLQAPEKTMKRRVILALNPFSGKWFWQTTGTATDDGKGDGMDEPFPGWNLIGEGVWAKGAYVIAGGPPFLLAKKVSIIHDEIVFETLAEYPTLEAAVMRAELADDLHSDDDGDLE